MRKENIYKYSSLGGWISWYRAAHINMTVKGENGLIVSIRKFMETLDELGLNVTYRAASDLEEFKEELIGNRTTDLSVSESRKLSKIANTLLPTLKAEIKGYEVFVISDKRYSIEKLTERISDLFAPQVYSSLPEIARYDISHSGKCILFEVPTAAAFHILRASESVVKIYYKKYLRRSSQGKTWGQLIGELINKNKGKLPNPITLNQLKHIKDSFRNPTQHPEKIYNIDEVQDLFNICVDVINRMTLEIRIR